MGEISRALTLQTNLIKDLLVVKTYPFMRVYQTIQYKNSPSTKVHGL